MAARRCSTCGINWPIVADDDEDYQTCPSCGEPTDGVQNAKPLKPSEAHSLAAGFKFDRMYAEWDETHDSARLDPANEPDPRIRGIYKRAEDLLSSRLQQTARTGEAAPT